MSFTETDTESRDFYFMIPLLCWGVFLVSFQFELVLNSCLWILLRLCVWFWVVQMRIVWLDWWVRVVWSKGFADAFALFFRSHWPLCSSLNPACLFLSCFASTGVTDANRQFLGVVFCPEAQLDRWTQGFGCLGYIHYNQQQHLYNNWSLIQEVQCSYSLFKQSL